MKLASIDYGKLLLCILTAQSFHMVPDLKSAVISFNKSKDGSFIEYISLILIRKFFIDLGINQKYLSNENLSKWNIKYFSELSQAYSFFLSSPDQESNLKLLKLIIKLTIYEPDFKSIIMHRQEIKDSSLYLPEEIELINKISFHNRQIQFSSQKMGLNWTMYHTYLSDSPLKFSSPGDDVDLVQDYIRELLSIINSLNYLCKSLDARELENAVQSLYINEDSLARAIKCYLTEKRNLMQIEGSIKKYDGKELNDLDVKIINDFFDDIIKILKDFDKFSDSGQQNIDELIKKICIYRENFNQHKDLDEKFKKDIGKCLSFCLSRVVNLRTETSFIKKLKSDGCKRIYTDLILKDLDKELIVFLSNKCSIQIKGDTILTDKSMPINVKDVEQLIPACKNILEKIKPKNETQKSNINTWLMHLNMLNNPDRKKVFDGYKGEKGERKFMLKLWDRNAGHDFFHGNYTGCCIAAGYATNFSSQLSYLIDSGIQILEIVELDDKGNIIRTIGQAFLTLNTCLDDTEKLCFTIENIEIHGSYLRYRNKIKEMIFNFLFDYASNSGISTQIILGKNYNKIDVSDLKIGKYKIHKLQSAITPQIYLDSLGGWVQKENLDTFREVEMYQIQDNNKIVKLIINLLKVILPMDNKILVILKEMNEARAIDFVKHMLDNLDVKLEKIVFMNYSFEYSDLEIFKTVKTMV
jgi:hypothetical protein